MAVNSFNAQNPPLTTKGDLFTFSTIPTRLGVGTNGQALLADSTTATGLKWGTAGTTPSFTLLGTGTTSSGTTVTVSGISGMNQLLIYFNAIICNTAGAEFRLRFNSDTGSNYNHSHSRLIATTNTFNAFAENAQSFIRLSTTGGASDQQNGYAMIYGCNSTNAKVGHYTAACSYTGSGGYTYNGGFYYAGSSTISSVSLITSLGTFNGGSFLVYGSA